jgi:hypothetical protein
MKYAVKMGSGTMIYIPNFVRIGSGIQELIAGTHIKTHTQIHRQQGDLLSQFSFF